ncbi:hypothetical protein BC833DRAFT_590415 [Globomyces pollinis-pini]|nr:hypothetical protein BC833DRAFT_590415 [Globomyces pollinis-pini]KAJ2996377.1 hypothetical protein HDV02_006588 [Globomyces sp. JEL0801]
MTSNVGGWQAVWDKEADAYYYWNPVTQETTWDDPNEGNDSKSKAKDTQKQTDDGKPVVDKGNEPVKTADDYYKTKEYYDWYMANMQQQQSFVPQTIKPNHFDDLVANPRYDPSMQQNTHSKEFRQMNYYFDTEKYQRDRALDRAKPVVKKKYTKKELEKFKIKKKEKKVASLLARMGPDL